MSVCPSSLPSLLVGTKIEEIIGPKGVDQMRKGKEAICPGNPQMTNNISSCTFNILFKNIFLLMPHNNTGIYTITFIFWVRKLRLKKLKGFE